MAKGLHCISIKVWTSGEHLQNVGAPQSVGSAFCWVLNVRLLSRLRTSPTLGSFSPAAWNSWRSSPRSWGRWCWTRCCFWRSERTRRWRPRAARSGRPRTWSAGSEGIWRWGFTVSGWSPSGRLALWSCSFEIFVLCVSRSAAASGGRRGVCRLHVELEGERLPDSAGATISGHEQPLHQGKKVAHSWSDAFLLLYIMLTFFFRCLLWAQWILFYSIWQYQKKPFMSQQFFKLPVLCFSVWCGNRWIHSCSCFWRHFSLFYTLASFSWASLQTLQTLCSP